MAKLDTFMKHKREVLLQRREDWEENPDPDSIRTLKASCRIGGNSGARIVRMGVTDVQFIGDSMELVGGMELGPSGPESLCGALANCLGHVYLINAALMNIPLDSLYLEVTGDLDYRVVADLIDTPQVQNFTYAVHIESPASAEDIQRLHDAVDKKCPVTNSIRLPQKVERIEVSGR